MEKSIIKEAESKQTSACENLFCNIAGEVKDLLDTIDKTVISKAIWLVLDLLKK